MKKQIKIKIDFENFIFSKKIRFKLFLKTFFSFKRKIIFFEKFGLNDMGYECDHLISTVSKDVNFASYKTKIKELLHFSADLKDFYFYSKKIAFLEIDKYLTKNGQKELKRRLTIYKKNCKNYPNIYFEKTHILATVGFTVLTPTIFSFSQFLLKKWTKYFKNYINHK